MWHLGCLPFCQKIQKFRWKVKWSSNFTGNPVGNCRLPPEAVQFFLSERNSESLHFPLSSLSSAKTITGNRTANGKRHLVRLPLFKRHPNRFILTNGKHPSQSKIRSFSSHPTIADAFTNTKRRSQEVFRILLRSFINVTLLDVRIWQMWSHCSL